MSDLPNTRPDAIIARIQRESGTSDLVDVLARRMAPTDLQSLLLEVHRQRSRAVTPRNLLEQYTNNRFVRNARGDATEALRFDLLAFEQLPAGFEIVELSPVCPLGTNSVLATVDQNKVVTTNRNSEVVADPTNVLALECAMRRRTLMQTDRKSSRAVKLCASHRVVRAQRFDSPLAFPHFRMMALTTAGRDVGTLAFETDALIEQMDYYLRVIEAAAAARASQTRSRLAVTDLCGGAVDRLMSEVVFPTLAVRHPRADLVLDPTRESGRGYYKTACFKIHCTSARDSIEVGDGGFTDWTAQLLSNRKERLLIGCVAGERVRAAMEPPSSVTRAGEHRRARQSEENA